MKDQFYKGLRTLIPCYVRYGTSLKSVIFYHLIIDFGGKKMSLKALNFRKSCSHYMTIAAAATVMSLSAVAPGFAKSVVITCGEIQSYSGVEVDMMLSEVRSSLGGSEENSLESKYTRLSSSCEKKPNSSQSVSLDPGLTAMLKQHGVNIH